MTGPGGEAREVLRPTRLLGDSTGITRVPPVVLDTTGPQWRRFTPSVAIQTNRGTLCTMGAQSEVVVSRLLGTGLLQTLGQFCYVQATADDLPIVMVIAMI